jgi:hypothetical protein
MLQILTAVALLAAAVVLPVAAVHGVVQMYGNKDRRGTISSGIAGMMTELDRVVRPSVRHVVEAKESVASHKDDIGGE